MEKKSYGNELLHTVLLSGMKDIDKICRENDIKYYLYAGTLLGAVVHKGFIPWDDDVDIVMFREDYDKFEKIIQEQYSDKYFMQTYITDYYHPNNRSKIRINGTKFNTVGDYDHKLKHNGVFIDIAPIYPIPNSKILRFIQKNLIKILDIAIQVKLGLIVPRSLKSKFLIKPLSKLNRVFLGKCMDFIMMNMGSDKSRDVAIICNTFKSQYSGKDGYDNDIIPKRLFDESVKLDFEGNKFMCIKNWDENLTCMYGKSYKEPYPEEKRVTTHSLQDIEIDEDVKMRLGI